LNVVLSHNAEANTDDFNDFGVYVQRVGLRAERGSYAKPETTFKNQL